MEVYPGRLAAVAGLAALLMGMEAAPALAAQGEVLESLLQAQANGSGA